MKDQTNPEPIRLTTSGYWKQIQKLAEEKKIPADLGFMLSALITCHQRQFIPPEATPRLTEEAKKHLSGGIVLSDASNERLYDVMVLVPNATITNPRLSFQLIPKWEHAELKPLKDF